MNDEQALVLALSLASTFAAGLAVERPVGPAAIPPTRFVAVVLAGALLPPLVAWIVLGVMPLGFGGIGLFVASAAPGGSTGPLLAMLAGGDPTTAARLFVVSTVLGTIGALAAVLALDAFDPQLVGRAAAVVVAASIAPLFVGAAVRRLRPQWARALGRPVARLSLALLVATVALFVVRYGERTDSLVLLGAAPIVASSLAPVVLVRAGAQRVAVAQVGAVHNLAVALLVLAALEAPAPAVLAVLGYGLVMYIVAGALAVFGRAQGASP